MEYKFIECLTYASSLILPHSWEVDGVFTILQVRKLKSARSLGMPEVTDLVGGESGI
jgi:hypothetical protein